MGEPEGELWDDDEFPKFQCGGDNLLAERGDVILVGVADLFEKAMRSELRQQA